ncbi:MAG: prepilin-type N-terminal cleavage/methylation domain-containing protein [Candidatus Aminicenantes bacterium]|nr:prepilin-type N-terminal cleavage/methylation domain-containing protein [Candidatus Aminicenantes bacterium]MCJ7486813.1 prepilin-type N-terminal cleavage/methylation domain-containing protein [Candidatus Aminicenantes bacterium]
MKKHCQNRPAAGGFTLIEVIVVVGIMGILMLASYPSILNTMATRNLENTTRQIQTYLQQTKLQAVSTRIVHRVRFTRVDASYWAYDMERLQPNGTWIKAQGAPRKTISNRLNVTITFPIVGADHVAVFSPLGTFPQFANNQNSITLQYPKLDRPGQMDERVLSIFMGGSIQYAKRKST